MLALSSLMIKPTSSNTAEAMAAATRSDTAYLSQVLANAGSSYLFGVTLLSEVDVDGVVGTGTTSSPLDSAELCSSKLELIFSRC